MRLMNDILFMINDIILFMIDCLFMIVYAFIAASSLFFYSAIPICAL